MNYDMILKVLAFIVCTALVLFITYGIAWYFGVGGDDE
jgi:hypothetical protein